MNIIITGASRGIGFEIAKNLVRNHRVLALSRNLDSLTGLKSKNPNLEIFRFDVSKKNELAGLTSFLKKKFPRVDILINNAGLLVKKPFGRISEEDVRATFETNLFGVIRLTQILLPFFKKSLRPHIVNIGSIGGFQGSQKFPGLSVYSSSKAALACLSECLAEELKEKKISVNCLALGSVHTQMLSQAFPGYKAPLTAKQMAEFIAEFSITGQKYLNGKVLPVSLDTP